MGCREVFDAVKTTDLLTKNFEKINLSKWHQPSHAGGRQLHLFSTRGFVLGVVAESLGHSLYKNVSDPGTAENVSTLVRTGDNQLVKSAIEFNDGSNLNKQFILCKSCGVIGAFPFSTCKRCARRLY